MNFIENALALIDEKGVEGTAELIAAEHNNGVCDAIEGFLRIQDRENDFWALDSLAYKVLAKIERLDVDKALQLCIHFQNLEGDDLAAGMLFNSLETYLSNHSDDAREAFNRVIERPGLESALPCVSRSLACIDSTYVCEKLLLKDSLAAIFSLQFCVSGDEDVVKAVEKHLSCRAASETEDDNIKRAIYLSAKAWGLNGLMTKLMEGGSLGVLRAVVTEMADPERLLGKEDFVRHMGYLDAVPKENEVVWNRLDRVMRLYYPHCPDECLRFVSKHLTKDCFPNFVQYLVHEIGDESLSVLILRFLSSGNIETEYFAFRIACAVKLNRTLNICRNQIDVMSLPYVFRKCLGWLYGRQGVCLPLCLSLMSRMSEDDLEQVKDLFYDPLCLHYTDEVAMLLDKGVDFANRNVGKAVRAILGKARVFYKELKAKGPCNELHPNPEMIVTARRKQAERMSTAFRKAQKESILGMLCEDHSISLLHGGKMICYTSNQDGLPDRREFPLHHHSVSIKTPTLLSLAGSLLEDRLSIFRMELPT